MSIVTARYASPVGTLFLYAQDDCIIRLDFTQSSSDRNWFDKYLTNGEVSEGSSPVLRQLQSELDEYFAGARTAFHVPCRLYGTDFQCRVWDLLSGIPYGQTLSYGALAARMGTPKASRAVGGANHSNPISIVIPCHRVVGADGRLTGYGGGLERKSFLLSLERAHSFM